MRALSRSDLSGVTIFELAIVVTVIGLVVGGIWVGADLMRQAELRTITKNVNAYIAAIGQFKEKYQYLPGDLPNAEDYWGSDDSCPNTAANEVPKRETCSGDGSGLVGNSGASYEKFRVWQHLADAELIAGIYTGVSGTGAPFGSDAVAGLNSPKIGKNVGFSFYYVNTDPTCFSLPCPLIYSMYPPYYLKDHVIEIADFTGGYDASPILEPAEAAEIDRKLDDGRPLSGKVQAPLNDIVMPNCITNDSEYSTTRDQKLCTLFIKTGL